MTILDVSWSNNNSSIMSNLESALDAAYRREKLKIQ